MTTELSTAVRQSSATEENGLSTREEFSRELTIGAEQARARYEIEGAILIAKKFPRNENAAFGSLMRSCGRMSFADRAAYCFPRGNQNVEGPSVYLAKEAARIWGNIRFGFDIIGDTEDSRHIRGWAWDVETNARSSYDDQFKKLVQRKQKGGRTEWIVPDERDLRELTNRRGAILVRNSILDLLPDDLIQDALAESNRTLVNKAKENIEDSRKKIILGFGEIGVSVEQVEIYLGHGIDTASAHEVANLRQIWTSINSGISKWSEYVGDSAKPDETKKPETPPSPIADALKNPKGATEANRQTEEKTPEVKTTEPEKKPAAVSAFLSLSEKIDAAKGDGEIDDLGERIAAAEGTGDINDKQASELNRLLNLKAKQINEG